jgi:hypothetical protein
MQNTSILSVPIAIRIPTDVYFKLESHIKRHAPPGGLLDKEIRSRVNSRARKIIITTVRHDEGRKR